MFISLTFGNLWWWWKNRWIVREMRATGRCLARTRKWRIRSCTSTQREGTMQPVSCQHQWDGDFQLWAVNFRRNSWHSRLSIMDNHTYIIYICIIYIYDIYYIVILYSILYIYIYILYNNYTFSYSWFRWIVHVFGMPPGGMWGLFRVAPLR